MPIARNTSSSGAPKRSASRLDRMPAITKTAPRRMAMLTASREVMKGANHSRTRKLIPYRRHTYPPTGFAKGAAICPFFGPRPHLRYIAIAATSNAPLREHRLTAFSSFLPFSSRFDDGHGPERFPHCPADGRTLGRRRGHVALVLSAARPGD